MTDWQRIVVRHGRVVWATAYRLLGSPEDAADCFQETFSPLEWTKEAARITKGMSEKQEIAIGQMLASVVLLVQTHPESRYAGKGVKLGEKDTPVFWYRPAGSKTHKVIYGDLSIKDVAEEDLPRQEQPEGGE